jgi:outer membrane protein
MTVARWRPAALVALAAGAPGALAAQQLEVTLGEAVRRAITVQPAMVQARGDARSAGAAGRSAWGAFLPTVTTSASASRSNTPRFRDGTTEALPPVYTYSGGLSASLTLFDGFRRLADLRTTSADQDAAGAGVVNERYQTTLATQQLFFTALANEELVRVAQAQVTRAEQQLKISVDKLRAGSATRSDTLRSTVDLGNARLQMLRARADLATAEADLGRQIGVDQPVRAVADTVFPGLPDTAALRASALQNAPLVQQAEAQERAAGAQVWSARAQYWPSLTVSYSNSRTGTNSPQFPLFGNYPESFSWRFGLSWMLFNGLDREQSQVSASVARDVARARAADARRQLNAHLTQQLAALFTTYEQIRISRTNVAAATEDLRVVQERYRVGAATILDLLTSQASLTQAEVSLVQARYDYLGARAQLEALVGHAL